MALTAYADADHAGCQDTRRSTSGSAQFLGDKLVSWSSKKQKSTAISTTEAEYIAMSGCLPLLSAEHTHKPKPKNTNLEVLNTFIWIYVAPNLKFLRSKDETPEHLFTKRQFQWTPPAEKTVDRNTELVLYVEAASDNADYFPRLPYFFFWQKLWKGYRFYNKEPTNYGNYSVNSYELDYELAPVSNSTSRQEFKSARTKDCWFQAVQDKIDEFNRLQVWELVPQPDYVMIIALKWIYKVKMFEYDIMADLNIPANDAPMEQAPAVAPPTRTDDQILPLSKWVPIGKSNCVLDVHKPQRNPIFPIVVALLKNTNFFRAFTTSFTIPAIYIQQDALDITPANDNNPFVAPPSSDTVIDYVNTLGYPSTLRNISAMKNLATASRGKKKTALLLIPNVRFTKLIIHHLRTKHNIHLRTGSPLHYSHDENVLNTLRFVRKDGREIFRMPIPDALLTDEIKGAPYYNDYQEHVAKYQQFLDAEHGKAKEGGATESSKATKVTKAKAAKVTKTVGDKALKPTATQPPKPKPTPTQPSKAGPAHPMVIREHESGRIQPLPEASKINAGNQEGQAGPNPGEQDEGQAGPNPGIAVESQLQTSHVENLKLPTEDQVILEEPASSTATLSSLQNLDKDLSFTDQFIVENPHEEESGKTNAETEVSQAIDEIVTDAVDWAMQAPLCARFRDLPTVDMKEIIQQRMFKDDSYKAHTIHNDLYEALQKSLDLDYSNQRLADQEKARKKKRKRRDVPRTPHGSPPS
ncbi:retrovirus-related pol polyprotein from transposon TNT 1-94 [Tanacetum coccineum]